MSPRGPQLELAADGTRTLPTSTVTSGCGFLTGESTSDATGTATVLLEELLDQSVPCLLVDVEQRWYGLKDQYELLHLGDTDHCDARLTAAEAATIAELLVDEEVPAILEVGGFTDGQAARELVAEVVDQLFDRVGNTDASCVIVVQEFHEFLPGLGGLDEAGEQMQRVAESGPEQGLGLCGYSEQPTVVDETYLADCDWHCWHRVTDDHDVDLAESLLGADAAAELDELAADEAFLQLAETDTCSRVTIRPQETPDVVPTSLLDEGTEAEIDARPVAREHLTALGVSPAEIDAAQPAEAASAGAVDAKAEPTAQEAATSETTRLYRGETETTAETIVEETAPPVEDDKAADEGAVEAAIVVDEPAQELRPSKTESETKSRFSAPVGPPRPGTEQSEDEEYHPIWEAGYFLLFCLSTVAGMVRGIVTLIERVIRTLTRSPPRARVVGEPGRLSWQRLLAYLCLLGGLAGVTAVLLLG